ncbi:MULTISPECIES: type II toxin-antitoxin system RelB/DinJ family antitoxin [Bifidobacterium]|uniref:Translation repressor RelB n=1 Tax=Bifidobacterium tibiigranuli TaxID=2172043 RepID=A0A5N6S0K2_9BIFI|nr:type II toxin-antitoxin system RelB/DinJ family antitoxin [Bifidobacterium tibiigranuli]KAE8127130.1 translation repressor RelB [Bifidobacterium tibiigranuli]KAE8127647.1 translation repressor RelB [Bifidobacterium tibiigranuli]MCH3974201.1 type II toxin-antitoxin system RelB/DinJ family antitoxin [Bifidobacterium tibiigranuli]MCH4188764.1 type II toxin-antitoxin system RelB/DinJ family antitoxin [Bifidobacterium tibiigranuli]MCH4203331.1 type II toxin-antitoxin system RelB/DinJ family anti
MSMQIATRVDDNQAALFKETTKRLGTTPADALRMFINAFNEYRGFPYEVRLAHEEPELFSSENDATDYASRLALRLSDETR